MDIKISKAVLLSSMVLLGGILLFSCKSSGQQDQQQEMPPQQLPVLTITPTTATTFTEFTTSLQGKVNVEVRPQVDGYLQKVYVDEGQFVKAGQPLFKIDDRVYREQVNTATAALHSAEANLSNAQLEIDKLTPLVQNKVVSEVQLKTAKASYQTAKANVESAKAMVASAQINVGYSTITAPVSGYIGRLTQRVGSLVGKTTTEPLTVLTDVSEIYGYFSVGEADFMRFKERYQGNTLEEKLRNVPGVTLILADGSEYPQKGKVQMGEGQFDKATGSISLRATFPNSGGILRSGNTGKIRLVQTVNEALVVPQESTVEMQDKIFVYLLADSNKVKATPITVSGKSGTTYVVTSGIKQGDKVVFTGIGNLQDGMKIVPKPMNADSTLKVQLSMK
ncbi:efflux RND transporter periplasmic adaptor subunit [Solitalea sp. MAHUQ-68]|uniref:Efflux RND transporter periplasmic adaptor subunit n=1 Tax=Solitalea agri TaxID=2953739 RepID=A0A9X2F330_9SPHI|nr:efflux RND transporter periplasmic adaptor subunit [Solitalea agri]MCO4293299.1 efflux RND transporter periplasmic adaptor subunit [Solitalea agri]